MDNITFEEAITNILVSINKEQSSLTRLLEVEQTKINKFIDLNASEEELLQANQSINNMIEITNRLNEILKNKLEAISQYLVK